MKSGPTPLTYEGRWEEVSNRRTVRNTVRVIAIVDFLRASHNSMQELYLRGRVRETPRMDALHAETLRTIAMIREFSLPQEEDYFCNDMRARSSGLPSITVGQGGSDDSDGGPS